MNTHTHTRHPPLPPPPPIHKKADKLKQLEKEEDWKRQLHIKQTRLSAIEERLLVRNFFLQNIIHSWNYLTTVL